MRYMDLFSGIGGFALGLKQARIEFEEHWFSEIDKNAINIYKKHFPNAKELGDVRAIRDFSGIKADIITFGFPCQDLSVAGKRRGLAGDRSGLFFEAMRIIRELKPQYFIFENVKGLLTNNGGADYVRCLREIADIGLYECEWQLVNTSWVLPQNRERVYFVGRLGGQSGAKIFPLFSGGETADGLQGQYTNTITSEGYTKNRQASYVIEGQQFQKVRQINRTEKNHQQKDDFYQTPEWVTRVLLGFHKFDGEIWEPAAGCGDMAEVLKKAGYEVYATDLVNRGYCPAGIDFLLETMRAQNIVTNPPFNLAYEFMEKGLELAERSLALLLPIRYLCGKKRAEFFLKHPPAKIIVIPNKIDFHGMGNPMIEFAWYVWDKGAEGTKIYWAEWK